MCEKLRMCYLSKMTVSNAYFFSRKMKYSDGKKSWNSFKVENYYIQFINYCYICKDHGIRSLPSNSFMPVLNAVYFDIFLKRL